MGIALFGTIPKLIIPQNLNNRLHIKNIFRDKKRIGCKSTTRYKIIVFSTLHPR